MTPAGRAECAALGLLAVVGILFFPVVAGRRTLMPAMPGTLEFSPVPSAPFVLDPMDSAWQSYPLAVIVHQMVRRGEAVTWSPLTGCGEPLVPATLGSVTSPLRWWIRWIRPTARRWDAFLLLRLGLAGALALGAALALGLPLPAAVAAAAAYMLSGQLIANLNLSMLDADVLLPGLVWSAVRLARGTNRRDLILPALLGAGVLLVGNPQSALLAGTFAAALGWARSARRGAGLLPAALGAGLLAAPLLFSFADFFPRAQQVHAGQGTVAAPWQGAISLAAPWVLGKFGEPWLGRNPFDFLAWLGAVPLGLAVLGARAAWRTPGGPVLVLAPIVLWGFAFGLPPLGWIARLPVLNLIWWSKYQAVSALAVACLTGFGARRLARPGWREWLPAALVIAELGWLVPRTWPAPHEPLATGTASLAALAARADLANERVTVLGRWPMPHPVASLGLMDQRTYFGLYPRRSYWYVRALITGPARTANEAVFTGPVRPLLSSAPAALAALGVRWAIAGPLSATPPPRGAVPRVAGIPRILELPGARSRARLMARAVRVPDAAQALRATAQDPAGDTAFVEGPPDWIGFRAAGTPGPARVMEDRSDSVRVKTPGAGLRLLVLADSWEPGWRADAGAARLRVLPANCMARAVAVPPGAAEVRFTYDPLPLKTGLLASGLGAGALLSLLLPGAAHRRRRRRA